MNFEKSKIEIFWSGKNTGMTIIEGGKSIDWNNLTHDEQLQIVNSLADMYYLFGKSVKEE